MAPVTTTAIARRASAAAAANPPYGYSHSRASNDNVSLTNSSAGTDLWITGHHQYRDANWNNYPNNYSDQFPAPAPGGDYYSGALSSSASHLVPVAATESSWQEEAHWMSFRHAIQQFASLKLTVARDEQVARQKEEGQQQQPQPPQKHPARAPSPTNSEAASDGGGSAVSSLTSDLAETKMRLALAQAERDELEFALLQRPQQQQP